MILSPKDIQELLKKTFSKIRFLETVNATTGRFRNKNIIVFEYTNIAGENLVLKFFSLQKLEEDAKALEKADLLEEFRRIKSFGNHTNLVRVYDANELWKDDELIGFYITMEKFSDTLAALIRREYRFNDKEVENFLNQMDNILEHAHYKLAQPIVHSDIKPDNIGIRRKQDGSFEYALMDFDISTTLEKSKSGGVSFTLSNKALMRGVSPAYAPPEQVMAYIHKSGEISNRVDVYAVGAVALEMLTGRRPRKDEGMMYYELPVDQVAGNWQRVFERLCNPDPKKRVRRISEAFTDVEISEDESAEADLTHGGNGPISFKIEQGALPSDKKSTDEYYNSGPLQEEPFEEDEFYDELFDEYLIEEERRRRNMTWLVVIILLVVAGGSAWYYFSSEEEFPVPSNGVVTAPGNDTNEIQPYTTEYDIGDRGPANGLIFYDKGVFSDGWRYLEAAPEGWHTNTEDPRLAWGCRGLDIRGTGRDIGHGQSSTLVIAENCEEEQIAAKIVSQYSVTHEGERFTDWFIPSRTELNMMYRNLQQRNIGGFSESLYWTSSQVNSGFAWVQNFSTGSQSTDFKSDARRVRPIRAF